MLNKQQEAILKELPIFMRDNSAFREEVLSIARFHFADKVETESRFDRMMALLEEKIAEDRQKWAVNERRWEENRTELVELNQRLDKKMEEDSKKWAENKRQWEEQRKADQQRWEEHRKEHEEHRKEHAEWMNALQEQGKQFDRKFDQTLGALGARWGLHSEAAFRNALAGILKEFSDVKVLNVNEYDHEGVVFGRPDQVELDVVIKNGLLMVCEIKSSMSKSEMYTFEKKVRFYEQKQGSTAHRMIVISPMVDPYALPVAEKLGIEVYSYTEELKL